MKGKALKSVRSASQGRKRQNKSKGATPYQEDLKNKAASQSKLKSQTPQQGKGSLLLQNSEDSHDFRSPQKLHDSILSKTLGQQPNELVLENLLLVKSVNFKAYNVSSISNLPVITAENNDSDSPTLRGKKVMDFSAIQQPQHSSENEADPLTSSATMPQKLDTISGPVDLQISKKSEQNEKGERIVKIKSKKTTKASGTIATEENRVAKDTTPRTKNVRAASESVNRKNDSEITNNKRKSALPNDLAKSQTIKSVNQLVTPRDSSANLANKVQNQLKKDPTSLTMPAISQTNPTSKKKEKTVLSQIGEEKSEKPILKNKLPNFGPQVDRKPKESAKETATSKATTSLPATTMNKVIKTENPSDRQNAFTIRMTPSKLLPSKEGLPKKNPEEQMSKIQINGNASSVGTSTNISEVSSSTRNISNVNIRTKSPTNPGVDTKSVRAELLPGEKEKRRLTYVAPAISNNYKYFVGGGNNSGLVKRVLAARDHWEEIESFSSLFNLKWQQSYHGFRYERLVGQNPKQIVNHFEFHKEISTKNGLIQNLTHYCEQNKIELFDLTPITFTFDMDDDVRFERDLIAFSHFFRKNCGDPKALCFNEFAQTKKTPPNVMFTFDLKRKTKPIHIPDKEFTDKKTSSYLQPKIFDSFFKGSNLWLLKPTGYNRGVGIEIFNSLQALNKYLNEWLDGESVAMVNKKKSKPEDASDSDSSGEDTKRKKGPPTTNAGDFKSRTFVVQKYIESPLLVFNRKFDIRAYAIVTHDMKLYFFKEGYLRTSSEEFTIGKSDIDNKFIHLTNDAVQKFSENYGAAESANKLSYREFQAYLDKNNIPLNIEKTVVPRMKELVEISMSSVAKLLNQHQRKYCFEIFGYDFIIDSDFNVFLIEVNTNPCLEEASPQLAKIIPRMLHDGFKLTVDVLFPPKHEKTIKPQVDKENVVAQDNKAEVSTEPSEKEKIASPIKESKANANSKFKLEDYNDDQNLWEFLCALEMPKGSPKKAR